MMQVAGNPLGNPLTMNAYAPGVDDEVTDRVDMSDEEYIDYYGKDKNGNPVNSPEGPFVPDATQDAIQNLARDLNIKLNNDTKDYLYQYYLQSKRDEWAYSKSLEADSTRYQRAVEDLKKAGLNPFLALQSLGGSSANASAGGITSGSIVSSKNAQRQASTQMGTSILGIIGIIAAALVHALA